MSVISLMTGMETLDWDRGWDYKKVSSSLLEWQENNFSLPATVAGRLDKLLVVKPPNNFYKLQISFSTTALLRQDSHFSAKFLHVHCATKFLILQKQKQAHFRVKLAGSNLARNLTQFDPQK